MDFALESSEANRFNPMPRVTITVPGKNAQPYRFQLDRESVTLGRGSDNDIAIDSGSVSVKHAEMRRMKGGYELRDLGSTNGTKLDGERIHSIPLRNGLSVKLGDVAFDFLLTEEELDTLAREKPSVEASSKSNAEENPIDLPSEKEADELEMAAETGGGSFGMWLLFLILASAAFFAGMAVRFQKDTGGSFIDAIQAKHQTAILPAPPTSPDGATDAAAPAQ